MKEMRDWSSAVLSVFHCPVLIVQGASPPQAAGRGRWSLTGVEPVHIKSILAFGVGVRGEGRTHVWNLLTFSWGGVWSFQFPTEDSRGDEYKGGRGQKLRRIGWSCPRSVGNRHISDYHSAASKPEFLWTGLVVIIHRPNLFSFMMDPFSSSAALKLSFIDWFCLFLIVGTKKRSMTSKRVLLQRDWGVAPAIHVMVQGVAVGAVEAGPQWQASAVLVVLSSSCSITLLSAQEKTKGVCYLGSDNSSHILVFHVDFFHY